ncbi:MAG TPA: hypothetical protein VGB42_05090 [Candidatus Thermoplasmatota archaeon]
MAILRSRGARLRHERIRALTPAALELSGLLAELSEATAGAGAEAAAKRKRAAELARHVMREAEELRWDPRISEEFREVLAHTRARLEGDPRVREILRDEPPARAGAP